MSKEEKIKQFNELLVSISTNMMLHQMDGLKKDFLLRTLSFQEMHTIEIIGNLEEVTMGELAGAAKVTQGTMSVMVKKLVKKGLVERNSSSEDLRMSIDNSQSKFSVKNDIYTVTNQRKAR